MAADIDLSPLNFTVTGNTFANQSRKIVIPAGTKVRIRVFNPNARTIGVFLGNDAIVNGRDKAVDIVVTVAKTITTLSSVIVLPGNGTVSVIFECIDTSTSNGDETDAERAAREAKEEAQNHESQADDWVDNNVHDKDPFTGPLSPPDAIAEPAEPFEPTNDDEIEEPPEPGIVAGPGIPGAGGVPPGRPGPRGPGAGGGPPGADGQDIWTAQDQAELDRLRGRLNAAEAALAQARLDLEAAQRRLEEVIRKRDEALQSWREADQARGALDQALSGLRSDREAALAEKQRIGEVYDRKWAEWDEGRAHLDKLLEAIAELNRLALNLGGQSDALADKAAKDAYNAAVQGVSAVATAGVGRVLDGVAEDLVTKYAKEARAQGRELSDADLDNFRQAAREKLQENYGNQVEEQIGEAAGEASQEGGTLDDLSINIPGIGDVGVGDIGSDAVDAAVNVGGAIGNLIAAIGVGEAGGDVAAEAAELNRSLSRFSGEFERQNAELGAELQSLLDQEIEIDERIAEIDKSIADTETQREAANDVLTARGEALLAARAEVSAAQGEVNNAQAEVTRLSALVTQLRAQVAAAEGRRARAQRNAALTPRDNGQDITQVATNAPNAQNRIASAHAAAVAAAGPTRTYASARGLADFRSSGFTAYKSVDGTMIWTKGSFTRAERHFTGAENRSDTWAGSLGINRQFTPRVSAGLSLGLKHNDSRSNTLGNTIESLAMLAGLNANIALADRLTLDLAANGEWGRTDILASGAAGTFDYRALTLGARLRNRFDLADGWWVEPSAGVHSTWSQRDSYVTSNGNRVASTSTQSARMTFGPRMGKRFVIKPLDELANGELHAVSPSFGLSGGWALLATPNNTLVNGQLLPNNDRALTLSGALDFQFEGGATAHLGASHSWSNDEVRSFTVNAGIDLPLDVLFPNALPGSKFGLAASAGQAEASARARIRVPLK